MAASNRGGGEGTHDRGGVRSTLTPAFNKPGKGSQDTMKAPFNAPRTGGDNGLPTQSYDESMPGPGRSAARSTRDDPGEVIWTDPHNPRSRR